MMTEGSIEVNVDVLTSVTAMFFFVFYEYYRGRNKKWGNKKEHTIIHMML